jgi:hypothetical protein
MTPQSNPDSGAGTVETLLNEFGRVMKPVVFASEAGPEGFIALIENAGLGSALSDGEGEQLADTLSENVLEPIQIVNEHLIQPDQPDLSNIGEALGAIDELYTGITTLNDIELSDDDLTAAGDALLDYLLLRYLEREHPKLYNAVYISGLVEPHAGDKPDELKLEKLGDFVSNPKKIPSEALELATDEFDAVVVLIYLKGLLHELRVPAWFETPSDEVITHLQGGAEDPDPELVVPVVSGKFGSAGVKLVPLPKTGPDEYPGAALLPYGVASISDETSFDLGEGWSLTTKAQASGSIGGVALSMRPTDSTLETEIQDITKGSNVSYSVHSETDVTFDPSAESADGTGENGSEELVLIGKPGATRVSLLSISLRIVADYSEDGVELKIESPSKGRLLLSPQGGFLSEVIPEDIEFDFDATVGWSLADGLYFEGGGTIEATIPLHLDLGFAELKELFLAVNPEVDEGDIAIETAASPKISLGPVTGSVRRMGLAANVTVNQDGEGAPLAVDVGFRPPDGIGLSVDAGPVTGGGFLQFEPEKNRYAGGLELQFSSWGLTVVGLLKTELPGTDGYSLLLLVTADLPQIQLGFGFVLTGIGGLAGIHRGFKPKPLGKAVRSGNLDSVLFPENVVENADQIITDLRAIFPPKADKHVFGPMLRLGWGTPVIIKAEMGVLVAVPDWKIALLGKFMLDLPDEEVALIDVNLAVVGFLDIPGERLSIDASLYDSRIVSWTVSGDMAMRLSWGAESRFMLSLGGFHPRYEPPKGFPELDRIKASMSPPSGNPRLEYSGYLAVTPNTFQIGAGVVLHGEFGPAVVHGELSIDALLKFNPFKFIVDFFAKVAVKIKGSKLGLKLDGTISGPGPYRVKGTLTIDVVFISVTVNVDAKFGSASESKEMPTANVLPELVEALETPANWSAQDPEGGAQLVSLRDPNSESEGEEGNEPTEDTLLAHPLGTLGVRQQVVPIGVDIEKYGNAKPAHSKFSLSSLSVTGVGTDLGKQEDLREKFAPAKFKKMSDSEKMESEPFERLPAGKRVENGAVHYAGRDDPSLLSWATLEYEASVIDEENESYRTTEADMIESWEGRLDLETGHELAEQSAVATAGTRTNGPEQYENPDQELSVSVDDQRYVVAWMDTLSRLDIDGNPEEGRTRVEARDRMRAYVSNNDATEDDLQVVGVQELAGSDGGASS